jgi:hypothetical protein
LKHKIETEPDPDDKNMLLVKRDGKVIGKVAVLIMALMKMVFLYLWSKE